jgi:hypothetical protein
LIAAKAAIGNPKIIVSLDIVRLDSYGVLIGFYRILMAAKFAVGNPKIIVCLG